MKHDCPTDGCCATCDSVVMMAKACLPCDVSAATKRDCEMREGRGNKCETLRPSSPAGVR
jgi:hypothetical protein